MTDLHLDILDDARKNIFFKLEAFKKATLGGGTALALQIGHRRSFDFDLFFPEPIPFSLYATVQKVLGESPIKLLESSDQLTVKLAAGVEMTFLHYWFKPVYPVLLTNTVPLFDFRDIATDKAFTIGRRNVWRDYIDLFFLLHGEYLTLSQLITDAQKRFGNEFSPKLFLQQLSFTGDIKDFTVAFTKEPYSPEVVTKYLAGEVKKYTEEFVSEKMS